MARDRWAELQRAKKDERDRAMSGAACDCYAAELSATADQPPKPTAAPPSVTSAGSPITVPCVAGSCPPGVACRSGFCDLAATQQDLDQRELGKQAVDYLAGKVVDDAKDKVEDQLLKAVTGKGKDELIQSGLIKLAQLFGAEKNQILGTMAGRIITEAAVRTIGSGLQVFEYTTLSLNSDGYRKMADDISIHLTELAALVNERSAFDAGAPARGPQQIAQDAQRVQNQLTSDVQMLAMYHEGIKRENELPLHACSQVLDFQHQQIVNTYTRFLGLGAAAVSGH